jgi:carbamoyl-phosphate synthase small subunit
MRAVLSTETDVDTEALKLELASSQGMLGRELVSQVTAASPYELPASAEPRRGKIAAIDLGIKRNMIDLMRARGYDVRVLPATSSYADLIAAEPDGVFVSNGPGDPSACGDAINLIGQLIEASSIPVFGVCLGHQVLCLALGGSTYKLKFGHRGSNHPVQDLSSHRVLITSQNHGFAVDETSLAGNVIVTHRSLNDGTVEGFELQGRPIFGVQFHPEASPGPRDARDLFDRFAVSISEN